MSEALEVSEKIFDEQKKLNESVGKLEAEKKSISIVDVRVEPHTSRCPCLN